MTIFIKFYRTFPEEYEINTILGNIMNFHPSYLLSKEGNP